MCREAFVEDGKVRVTFKYNPSIIDKVKTISGRKYNTVPYKHWTVPFSPWHCEQLVSLLSPFEFQFDQKVLDCAASAEDMKKRAVRTSSKKRMGKLRKYQVAGVEFMEASQGLCLNCDQMGLGKTAQALTYAKRQDDIEKILVVCPASVLYNWGMEVEKWTNYTWSVVGSSKEPIPPSTVVIVSYTIATLRGNEIREELQPDLIIFDEFHYIKNPKAKRTRAAKLYALSAPHVIGLSGTPMLSRPYEMLNMLQIIQPGSWDTTEYAFRYCDGWNTGRWAGGATNTEELADRLKTVMIRRTKDEVDLPDLTRVYVPVDINLEEYNKVAREVAAAIRKLSPSHKGYYVNALDKLNMLRQVLGQEKMVVAMDWITNFLDSQEENTKLVIYAHHNFVVEKLRSVLGKYGVTSITGDVPAKERMNRVRRFQQKGGPRVMIITSAGGEGINLYGEDGVDASSVLFIERQWTPAAEEQAESRLHRMGQKNAVSAYYLIAKNTVDETINQLIDQKRRVIDEVVGTEDSEISIVKGLLSLITGD